MRKRGRDLVERVAGEPASGKASQECRRDALAREQTADAGRLGVEGGHCVGDSLGPDQAPTEVGSDRGIAVAAAREHPRPALCQPRVVDEPSAIETRERLLPRRAGVPRSCQPPLELAARSPARRERPSRLSQRSRATYLACKLARGVPIQASPDRNPCPDNGICRQHTPRLTVELDGHPAAPALSQSGDGRRHASASAEASASAATSALPFDAADSSAATGSSRADATWSEPSSTWICWRICCVTSGCSRRKAVAF